MSRSEIIGRISALSDAELELVEPYIAADLDALGDLDELREEIRRGQDSARTGPLLDHEAVMARVRERLTSRT